MNNTKLCKCRHGIGRHINELGEEEIYCEVTARWMNVTLGDCLGNCESEEDYSMFNNPTKYEKTVIDRFRSDGLDDDAIKRCLREL